MKSVVILSTCVRSSNHGNSSLSTKEDDCICWSFGMCLFQNLSEVPDSTCAFRSREKSKIDSIHTEVSAL